MAESRRIYIGLPAFNEEIALPRLMSRIDAFSKSSGLPIATVLYNDGSTDATLPIAREWSARLPLVIIDGAVNKGLGAGLRALVNYAADNANDADILVVMDCDDTHDPAQIAAMLPLLADGADVVIASRYVRGATVQGVPAFRRVTALGAAALFKLIHPVHGVWDYTCGYRAYRVGLLKRAAARYGDKLIAERGFACMVELLLKLNTLGARFTEIPLRLRYDQKPTASKMGVGGNIRRLLTLMVHWRARGFGG